jgi:hypothetical protein
MRFWASVLALGVGLFAALAKAQHNHTPGTTSAASAFWAGPWVSGSWFDPARSGEGIILQHLPNGRVLALWFTFAAASEASDQAWMIASDGVLNQRTLRFPTVLQPKGGEFGDRFDPARVVGEPWGTLELEFTDCNTVLLRYAGPTRYGQGTRQLQRLSSLDQLGCDGARTLTESGARAANGLQSKSGAWFVPGRSGEGWLIEDLADGRSVVYWFTFSPEGRQAWLVGTGRRSSAGGSARIEVSDVFVAGGARFGDAFRAADVRLTPWGSLQLTFTGCDQAEVRYQSSVAGYGSASRQATRLTSLTGAECLTAQDLTPRINGNWRELAMLPGLAQSELAATAWAGKIYALGGFGDPRGFKSYDIAADRWQSLAPMPAGRDHLAGFALDGGVFFTGGAGSATDRGDAATSGFRYDIARGVWEARAELPAIFGNHAAVLAGRAYIGDADGSLTEYDPIHRVTRRILRAPGTPDRDHSNVVAFQSEIWMLAGRSPEHGVVAIYNPMSEAWRLGPSLQHQRGGFAAAVVGHQIVVTGGDVISGGLRLERTTEIFTAGSSRWVAGPTAPLPTHGVGGAGWGESFYAVSGSTRAGQAVGATGRLFDLVLQ